MRACGGDHRAHRKQHPAEIRVDGKVVWNGQMNLELNPNQMAFEMIQRASREVYPDGKNRLVSLSPNLHPNDLHGEPVIIGDASTWRFIIEARSQEMCP